MHIHIHKHNVWQHDSEKQVYTAHNTTQYEHTHWSLRDKTFIMPILYTLKEVQPTRTLYHSTVGDACMHAQVSTCSDFMRQTNRPSCYSTSPHQGSCLCYRRKTKNNTHENTLVNVYRRWRTHVCVYVCIYVCICVCVGSVWIVTHVTVRVCKGAQEGLQTALD